MNILEGCRHNGVKHLLYASSSSVYGASTQIPFSEHNVTDHPVSLYAAEKSERDDGAQLFFNVRPSCDGASVLYRLWPMGTP